jgi:hypothetical protein
MHPDLTTTLHLLPAGQSNPALEFDQTLGSARTATQADASDALDPILNIS